METTDYSERPVAQWDGALTIRGRNGQPVADWKRMVRAARSGDCAEMIRVIAEHPDLANSFFRTGRFWSTPLFQAASHNAPEEVILRLIGLGAFRSIKCTAGQRPFDIAKSKGFHHLLDILEPKIERRVDGDRLAFTQEMFHGLIRAVMLGYRVLDPLRLPELSILTEYKDSACWFPIPGMSGGFQFWLEENEAGPTVIAESWSRMVDGSGMRHRATAFEVILEEVGFV